MKIDTKARWAIAAILDMAVHGTGKPVRLADISKRQGVSQSHLEHLFRRLRDSGFVSSARGPGGGYRLNRCLAMMSVADIIGAVDDKAFSYASGHGGDDRHEDRGGLVGGLWCRLDDHLRDYLRSLTLESVLANAAEAAEPSERAAVVVTVPHVLGDTRVVDRSRPSLRPSTALGCNAGHHSSLHDLANVSTPSRWRDVVEPAFKS